MAAETSHGGTVPSEDVPGPQWLIDIINEAHEQSAKKTGNQADEPPKRPMTLIRKASEELRQLHKGCFDPSVVSLGPFHHGKPELMQMQSNKKDSAVWFISLATDKTAKEVTNVYQKFVQATSMSSPKDRYDGDFDDKYNEADLMQMMFLDGCFILHFIHHVVKGSSVGLSKSSNHLNQAGIVKDIFLLENQIPYPILNALMSLLPKPQKTKWWIIEFIKMVAVPPHELNFSEIGFMRVVFVISECFSFPIREFLLSSHWKRLFGDDEPLHLLDILRAVLVGSGPCSCTSKGRYWHYNFRPIRELNEMGIQVRRSKTRTFIDVKFQKGILNSHLEIPQTIVDDSTKTRLINLVAYEMCSDGPKHVVTGYVCLLHSLIYNADDAEKLQSKNILLNRLGSNEAVVNLFKELAYNLTPPYYTYGLVINGIKGHSRRHLNNERVRIGKWIGQFIRTYFSSPWTLISLIAAAFIIVLTLLQTIYTMWGFYKTY